MELYARQHQGGDTTELRKKVADLKQEVTHPLIGGKDSTVLMLHTHSVTDVKALALGLIDNKFPMGRGRSAIRRVMRGAGGVFRGRGRGGSARSVDHRPRTLQVTGFEDTEKEEVVAHLSVSF